MLKRSFACLFPLLLALLVTTARADVTLEVKAMDGDKVSDISKILAKADSPDGIEKVEFRVDDALRFTDTSTPYVYEWDTIADTEGEHTLSITAFDTNGVTKRVTVKLVIDNDIALGAGVLAQKAIEALNQKNYDDALKYGRRSLKAEAKNADGSRAVAGVYASRRELDKAIETLEKAKIEESVPALTALASYRIRRALLPENTANFFAELQAVTELRHRAADIDVKQTKEKYKAEANTPQAHEAIGDALLSAGRFHEAVIEYEKSGKGEDAPLTSVNRLGLAYILDDASLNAATLISLRMKTKKEDVISRAVYGLALVHLRRYAEATAAVQKDLQDQSAASLIVASYADFMQNKKKTAAAYAKDALTLVPRSADAHYANSLAALDARDSEQDLYQAIALAPFQFGPTLDYAARLLSYSKRADRYEQTLNITDLVLKSYPDNLSAKMLQTLVYLQTKRVRDAEPALQVMGRKHQNAADVQLLLSTYWELQNNGNFSRRYLTEARKMDMASFDLPTTPTPAEAMVLLYRKLHYRAGFFLTLDTLYPNRGEAPAN